MVGMETMPLLDFLTAALSRAVRPLLKVPPHRRNSGFILATLVTLAACSGPTLPEQEFDASIIRPRAIASLDEPESGYRAYWLRTTGAVPDDSSFRQYFDAASDAEIELAAKDACEAVFRADSVEIDFLREDFEAIGDAEAYLADFVEALFDRNQVLSSERETIADLVLWQPFVEAACPDLLTSE